ncbi:MAG: hypothetical protein ACPL4E_05220 [Thermoproteota archaeon]
MLVSTAYILLQLGEKLLTNLGRNPYNDLSHVHYGILTNQYLSILKSISRSSSSVYGQET